MSERYVAIVQGDKITIQESEYIEDGPFIEIIGNKITLYEIPMYGGEEIRIGEFQTIVEAIKHSKTLNK